jgi:hypothetical protein
MAEYRARRNPDRCPSHPGAVLDDIMPSLGKPKAEIARLLGISRQHLHEILEEKKPVSPNGAARIGKLKRTSHLASLAGSLRCLACRARGGREQDSDFTAGIDGVPAGLHTSQQARFTSTLPLVDAHFGSHGKPAHFNAPRLP